MKEKIRKYTFNPGKIPVLQGYIVTKVTAQKNLVSVTYQLMGQIIPIDTDGRTIKGVEPHYYMNNWHDPRRVQPNESVPIVKGYRPRKRKITPADATVDTAVTYDRVEPVAFPKPGMQFKYSENFGPDSQNIDGWEGNLGPHGEHIDSNGLIVNANMQVIGYVDSDGKAYYVLSHTDFLHDEDLRKALDTQPILSLGLIGLSGVKKSH